METLERRGIPSYVGAGTVRTNSLGERGVQPDTAQLAAMQVLVRQAIEEGAVDLTDALIYSPNTYGKTPELTALSKTRGGVPLLDRRRT